MQHMSVFKRRFATFWQIAFVLVLSLGTPWACAAPSLGLGVQLVSATPSANSIPLVSDGNAAPLYVDKADHWGVMRAATDLQGDIDKVTGAKPALSTATANTRTAVIIGTLGHSTLVDALVSAGKLDVKAIRGKWESFVIANVANPMPGVERALVIAGSDKRGTIYGIYEISEQIGVSPWYWWADVPVKKASALFVRAGAWVQGPPAVKYRGIFINDEEPALGKWSREKFGGGNSKMYTHMFELLLRLRANYLWPAMWTNAFNEDDPDNPRLADAYGIVMGTSHHEPMVRSHHEWLAHRRDYGNGEWNYATNEDGLKRFFRDGIRRNKAYESIVTMGMRGDGDTAMPDAGGLEANKKLIEKIIHDQQQILTEEMGVDQRQVPQLWALFTEVQKYYDAGLKVPDNVTLLFTDDNVGNLRRLPTPAECKRSGGSGIYFHMDMNGGPFSYKWLNSNPLPKIWEQMNLAHEYGANQIWIANVGDLKPLEVPIEFFLRLAWSPKGMGKDDIAGWTQRWAEREFGAQHAAEIADLVAKYAKYNAWRKPELVRPDTFSLVNYREAERVSEAWNALAKRATLLKTSIPADQQDAYYELVLHPILALSNFIDLEIAAGRNHLYAKQGRYAANAQAERVRALFKRDQDLSDFYNTQVAGGKWNHMMDQTHIGYRDWRSPPENVMPATSSVPAGAAGEFGVAIDGSDQAWPGGENTPTLPYFDSINKQRSYIDVFSKDGRPPRFTALADKPWVKLSQAPAPDGSNDQRIWVDIDWSRVPVGSAQLGQITVSEGNQRVVVRSYATIAVGDETKAAAGAFGGQTGPIAFDAQDAVRNIPGKYARWEWLPDYGRGPGAMTVFPVTARSAPFADSPRLEYPVYFASAGTWQVDLVTAPTLDNYPGRELAVAVALDDATPQVVRVFPPATRADQTFLGKYHFKNTSENARTMRFTVKVHGPGKYDLKIIMVDPTIVVQKIVLSDSPLPDSYFGPPSTPRNPPAH
ncbi:glycosyl hydrolase 115 family protein [Massilia sp. CT11-108]|uniref:glycosyl hydrolase 115 family protein n=1 Tax=Massilia sp. CT11-108 TaxID=3393900 RepID=UPI0039A73129